MSNQARFEQNVTDVLEGSEQVNVPCGSGTMPFRCWQPWGDQLGGEVLVLLHGGSGSWTHWIRNIKPLASYYEVVVPDLPGLGDAASPGDENQPADAAKWVIEGLDKLLGERRYHLVAFSFGCVIASLVAEARPTQVKSLLLTGSASMGEMPRALDMKPLIPRRPDMSPAEVMAANRENLARLMIHKPQLIDDFAVYLQTENTSKARFKSPRFARGNHVLDALANTRMPLLFLYGGEDAVARTNLDTRQDKVHAVRPDAGFEIIEDAGHWLPYEAADVYNRRLVEWVEANIFN